MRIRRTVIAPLIITIGAIGSIVAPAAVALTAVSGTAPAVAASSSVYYYHT